MGRKKLNKLIAIALISTLVVGANISTVMAVDLSGGNAVAVQEAASTKDNVLKDGIYKINNITTYADPNSFMGNKMSRDSIDEISDVRIENGEVTITYKLSEKLFTFMQDIKVSMEGKDLGGVVDEKNKTITFKVPSVESKVDLTMFITMMGKSSTFQVENDFSKVKIMNEAPEINGKDVTVKVGDTVDLMGLVKVSDREEKNLVPQILGDTSFIKDGKAVTAGNYNITYKVTDKEGFIATKTINVRVEEKKNPKINEEPSDEKLVEKPVEKSTDKPVEKLVNQVKTDKKENKEELVKEEEEVVKKSEDIKKEDAKVNIKLYTIENEVSHENETGKSLARKYLNNISDIEEIDGVKYLTLTFNGGEFMNDYKVNVDGNEVENAVTFDDGKTKKIRFKISDINSTIKVSAYVAPMSRRVEFGVSLKEDTLNLVKEYKVDPKEAENIKNSGKSENVEKNKKAGKTLPQTGAPVGSEVLGILGTLSLAIGSVVAKRKK